MALDVVHAGVDAEVPFEEALEAVSLAAAEWGIAPTAVGPCFALLWRDGVACERHDTAFILALELRHLNKTEEEAQGLLYRWNLERLGGHIATSDLSKTVRNAFKPRYLKPPSCKNGLLRGLCVKSECYRFKSSGLWSTAPVSPGGLLASDLLPMLTSREWKLWCGLCELAKRKGLRPDSNIRFTYRELQRISGIENQDHARVLRRLHALGLIQEFKPSPPQPLRPEGGRKVSSCRLPEHLPTVEDLQEARKKLRAAPSKTAKGSSTPAYIPRVHTVAIKNHQSLQEKTATCSEDRPEEWNGKSNR